MTTKHEVIKIHREHPEWSSTDIAAALGCGSAYVRATARRNGLALSKGQPGPRGQLRPIERQSIYLAAPVMQALSGPAAERGLSCAELAREIIEIAARENLVAAILD